MACAVRSLDLRARLETPSTTASTSQVQVVLANPEGAEVASFALGATRQGNYRLEGKALGELRQGNYKVSVTATQALEASLELGVQLDYYETFEQSRTAHLLNGVGGCPGYM